MKNKILALAGILIMAAALLLSIDAQAEQTGGDGGWSITDARLILQHTVGKTAVPRADILRLDQNTDGKLDISDAGILLQKLVGRWKPEPWTEVAQVKPAGGEDIDFKVIAHGHPHVPLEGGYGHRLYLLKSPADIGAVMSEFSELYWLSSFSDFEKTLKDVDWDGHAVIIMTYRTKQNVITVQPDRIAVENGRLTVCNTVLATQNYSLLTGDCYWVKAIEIDLEDLEGVRSLAIYADKIMRPNIGTTEIKQEVSGESVDFTVMAYTRGPVYDYYPFMICPVRSMKELKNLYAWEVWQKGAMEDYTAGFDDAFFEDKAVIVVIRSLPDTGPLMVVDAIIRDETKIGPIIQFSTGRMAGTADAESSLRIVLAVDKADMPDASLYCWDSWYYWDPWYWQDTPALFGDDRSGFDDWFSGWMEDHGYSGWDKNTFWE
ncbi:MAG: hypothetical protein FWE80_01780 [Oscillospiraceae bacterium]|nr:hypothetical protein [Oscillospiraceae bacterium]